MAMIIPLFTQARDLEEGKTVADSETDKVFAEWVAEAPMETKAAADMNR
jgi:hypothetical protein